MSARILVVDDEAGVRESLAKILRYEGYEVDESADGPQALQHVQTAPCDLIFLDIKMPGMDGLEVLARMRELGVDIPVIIISGHGSVETAVQAVKSGAFNFLDKPLDAEKILIELRNALAQKDLERKIDVLEGQLPGEDRIVGESPAISSLLADIERVAPTEARVLITGENGVGKELVARGIHAMSPRKQGPFVAVNCAAIPTELIESELFGHEKGSFTGAHQRRLGKFEQAHGGTLFLDEIGDMSLTAQAKVLRVLQEGRLERVGGTVTLEVDVRVIAATNMDLLKASAENRFRGDLYYRLSVVPLEVPPLRERREDIPLLVRHFMTSFQVDQGLRAKEFDSAAMDKLKAYAWPGNIRELRNLVERLIIMTPGSVIRPQDVPLGAGTEGEAPLLDAPTFQEFKERSEAAYLRHKLQEWRGNVSQTARALDMQRSNLYKKIERYGLSASKDPREPEDE